MTIRAVKAPPAAIFRHRDFSLYASARFLALCSHQMLIVALSQMLYELTRDPLHLGYIGLALFLPKFGFTLPAGHAADRFDRRRVILSCRLAQTLLLAALTAFAGSGLTPLWVLYTLLFLLGTAGAFDGPASHSIVPELIPPPDFHNAVAWNSSVMQVAFITGPLLGGGIYALTHSALPVLYAVIAMRFSSFLLVRAMRIRTAGHANRSELSWHSLFAGLRYVFATRILLGVISLDLFAVLLGGAVALLPIFANDILKVGPSGFGLLRAAPAVGASLMALVLAHLPPLKRTGITMFICVAVFGLATIGFGLSRHLGLSLLFLFILGASDMISVIIRGVLVQVQTPIDMRGRVSAVNLVFIGASNELGEFESGVTARWFGTVPAVLLGGIGTLAVVAIWMWRFPELKRYRALEQPSASSQLS